MTDILALIDAFERHGVAFYSEVAHATRKPSRRPASWRAIARELVGNGDSCAAVARRMGVSLSTVKRWSVDLKPLPPWRKAQQRRIQAGDHVPAYVLRARSWRASA